MTNPYQAPQISEAYADNVQYSYAGFWIRVLASLIDGVCLLIVFFPLALLLGTGNTATLILQVIAGAAYVWFWVTHANTPGHSVLKLKILDKDTGAHLTVNKAILRYLGMFVSGLLLCLPYIWVAFDPKKQGIHDKLANSVVVRAS